MSEIAFVPPAEDAEDVFAGAQPGHGKPGAVVGGGIARAGRVHKKFKEGNRLPVPRNVSGHHFFYKVAPIALDQDDLDNVLAAAKEYVRLFPLGIADIGVLRAPLLARIAPGAVGPFERLIDAMGSSKEHHSRAAVLCCHWSAPHVDEEYDGYAFLSYVLHTGPEPYVVQTFHTEVTTGSCPIQRLQPSSRLVKPGDLLMLDPTTPHMAAPSYPGPDQLLVMIQVLIDETCFEDRVALLDRFPPADEDENIVL